MLQEKCKRRLWNEGLIIFFCAWDKSLNLVYRQNPQYGGEGGRAGFNASPGRFPRKESASLKRNLLRKDYAPARSVAATSGLHSAGLQKWQRFFLYASAHAEDMGGCSMLRT